jgi:hypothetical protein
MTLRSSLAPWFQTSLGYIARPFQKEEKKEFQFPFEILRIIEVLTIVTITIPFTAFLL